MANRTFLIEAVTEKPIPRMGEPEVALAAGQNCIPPFWYSLFDQTCICFNEVALHDGRIEQYPYLVTSINRARDRLARRLPILEHVFGRSHQASIDRWVEFVSQMRLPFVHLDPAELWMMIGPDNFNRHLNLCLEAFDSADTGGESVENECWVEMLDAAQLDPGDSEPSGFKLAGHSWNGASLPWDN